MKDLGRIRFGVGKKQLRYVLEITGCRAKLRIAKSQAELDLT